MAADFANPEISGNGLSGGYEGDNRVMQSLFAAFFAVAWYNVIELVILVFSTFKRYGGLYFWSLLIATIGIIPYSIGFGLKLFQFTHVNPLSVAILTIGYWTMVTGQSLVLWSRLHLVLQNPKLLRRVLWMIIIDAIILHIPTTTLTIAANCGPQSDSFTYGYSIMEKIQLTGFTIQEFILSALYIREAIGLLRVRPLTRDRGLIRQLLAMNLVIILMDAVLIVAQFTDQYAFQVTLKALVYSVKLKLEYAILSKLVDFVKGTGRGGLRAPYEDTTAALAVSRLSSVSSNVPSPLAARPSKSHRPQT